MKTYERFLEEWRDRESSVKCQTSGSTGMPKTIELPKSEMRKSARRTISFFGLDGRSNLHSCISPEYIGGKMMAVRSEECGGRLTWEVPSNRPLINFSGNRIDLLAVVPTQMIDLLTRIDSLPEIGAIIIGGAPITSDLRRAISRSGLNAWETYGMTETASHIALRRVTETQIPFLALEGIRINTTEDSRLVIDLEGWQTVVTNDIAEITGEGSFLIKGRIDNVINSGGKKIHPEEIEEKLERFFGVPVLITSRPDKKWGERVVMIIEDHKGHETDNKIISDCKSFLQSECVPKEIEHHKLPRTANGKKKRK